MVKVITLEALLIFIDKMHNNGASKTNIIEQISLHAGKNLPNVELTKIANILKENTFRTPFDNAVMVNNTRIPKQKNRFNPKVMLKLTIGLRNTWEEIKTSKYPLKIGLEKNQLCINYMDPQSKTEPCMECPLYQANTGCLQKDSIYKNYSYYLFEHWLRDKVLQNTKAFQAKQLTKYINAMLINIKKAEITISKN